MLLIEEIAEPETMDEPMYESQFYLFDRGMNIVAPIAIKYMDKGI
jgi:hypothetical protein